MPSILGMSAPNSLAGEIERVFCLGVFLWNK